MRPVWIEEERKRLLAKTCRCVSCGACGGTGNIMVRTGSYPEEDLDICGQCDGGLSEVCERCMEIEELEHYDE